MPTFQGQRAIRKASRPRPLACQREGGLSEALIEIANARYGAFQRHFGRDPGPDEPLFFNPKCERPEPADAAEMRRQLMRAAGGLQLNVRLLLKFFGLEPENEEPAA